MGYSFYRLSDGREAGYSVVAVCDEAACTNVIDRGLAYLCGDTPGGSVGCGGYYCSQHLFLAAQTDSDGNPQSGCARCANADEEATDG